MINTCQFCKKILDETKLEHLHGCLDCAGYIYIIDKKEYCLHCLNKKENNNLHKTERKILNEFSGILREYSDHFKETEVTHKKRRKI